ncbi:hypothetical protein F4775DRAFT_202193 [Biscogniauxia sp. FL1348]|nr:hypothetical protein F4775DRAFT_202193 [Biscogniauxia sp. FL1348]
MIISFYREREKKKTRVSGSSQVRSPEPTLGRVLPFSLLHIPQIIARLCRRASFVFMAKSGLATGLINEFVYGREKQQPMVFPEGWQLWVLPLGQQRKYDRRHHRNSTMKPSRPPKWPSQGQKQNSRSGPGSSHNLSPPVFWSSPDSCSNDSSPFTYDSPGIVESLRDQVLSPGGRIARGEEPTGGTQTQGSVFPVSGSVWGSIIFFFFWRAHPPGPLLNKRKFEPLKSSRSILDRTLSRYSPPARGRHLAIVRLLLDRRLSSSVIILVFFACRASFS